MGVGLLLLAVPRTIASWEAAPADRTIAKLGSTVNIAPAEFGSGIEVLRRSVEKIASGERLTDLGTLEVEQAQRMFPTNLDRRPLLEMSEAHLLAGLGDKPINGMAWYRLAQTRAARGAPPREVVVALLQSLNLSPSMRWLWLARAQGLFIYAGALQKEELLAVQGHLRTIWKADPALRMPLLRLAIGAGKLDLLSSAMEVDLEAKAEFEKLRQSPGVR